MLFMQQGSTTCVEQQAEAGTHWCPVKIMSTPYLHGQTEREAKVVLSTTPCQTRNCKTFLK